MRKSPLPCFTPLGDKVLIRHLQAQKDGLLFIPERIEDRRRGIKEIPAMLAEVVAVGSLRECILEPGQKVYVNPYSGTEIRFNGELYVVYSEHDLLAVEANSE